MIDNLDELLLARLRGLALPTVKILPWRLTGKRDALGVGVRAATGQIVMFADSDTSWRPGLLAALQMSLVNPMVGEVGVSSMCTCLVATFVAGLRVDPEVLDARGTSAAADLEALEFLAPTRLSSRRTPARTPS